MADFIGVGMQAVGIVIDAAVAFIPGPLNTWGPGKRVAVFAVVTTLMVAGTAYTILSPQTEVQAAPVSNNPVSSTGPGSCVVGGTGNHVNCAPQLIPAPPAVVPPKASPAPARVVAPVDDGGAFLRMGKGAKIDGSTSFQDICVQGPKNGIVMGENSTFGAKVENFQMVQDPKKWTGACQQMYESAREKGLLN